MITLKLSIAILAASKAFVVINFLISHISPHKLIWIAHSNCHIQLIANCPLLCMCAPFGSMRTLAFSIFDEAKQRLQE